MMTFFARSLIRLILTLFGILCLTFIVMLSVPGNPVFSRVDKGLSQEELQTLLKAESLEQSSLQKFLVFLKKALFLDFGISQITGEDINQELKIRIWNTLILALCGTLIFIIVGLGTGILGALYEGSFIDSCLQILTTCFIATPVFWFGLFLMFIFSIQFNLVPASGSDGWISLILPALTVGLRPAAFLQRLVQSRLSEILKEPYMIVALAKGLSPKEVVLRHALPNAMIPVLTVIGLEFAHLMTGAVVAECIFAYKGLGSYILFGIENRDYNIIVATVYLSGCFVCLINFVLELLYSIVDPRVRVK